MTFEALLNELRNNYEVKKMTFDDLAWKYNLGLDYKYGRINDFFRLKAKKRKDLFFKGDIYFGKVIGYFDNHLEDEHDAIGLVLYSFEEYFNFHTEELNDIYQKLTDEVINKKAQKKYRKLGLVLSDLTLETQRFLVPFELANNHTVYLSTFIIRKHHIDQIPFKKSIMPFILSPLDSKEIILLPNRYWTENFLSYYNS